MVSLKSLLLTSLVSLSLAAPAPAPAPQEEAGGAVTIFPLPLPGEKPNAPFNGIGQIRTRWWRGNYADLGCLTSSGKWTVDESQCGVFKADRKRPAGYGIDVWTLTSKGRDGGPCRIYGARFICEKGFEGYEFGAWNLPGGAIPGVECLRYGQYGPMANSLRNPPLATDGPQDIHLISYNEPGKYVWLTWAPLK